MKTHRDDSERNTVPMSKGPGDIAHTMLRTGMLQAPVQPGAQGAVDRFEIIQALEAGGMGQVFLAREPITGGRVALKMIRPELADKDWVVQRFLTEAQHMYRLSHPNILKVLEVSDRKAGPYYVMPFIEGGNLAQRIRSGVPLPEEFILPVSLQLAEALKFAHGRGIIHRDLKPANVMVDQTGCVYLTDFGLLRTVFNDASIDAGKDVVEGTAVYLSPLAASGKAEDTRCDIYAFGAILYEMLTGWRPYSGETSEEIIREILAHPPCPILELNPQASKGLTLIAEGCMARELRDRYAEMADVVRDLQRVARKETPAGPHGRPASMRTAGKFIKVALVGVAGVLGLAVAASLFWSAPLAFHAGTQPESKFFRSKLAKIDKGVPPRPSLAELPDPVTEKARYLATEPKEVLQQYVWIESDHSVYFARRIICKNWSQDAMTDITIPWTNGVVMQVFDYNGNALPLTEEADHARWRVTLEEPIPPDWTFRLVVVARQTDLPFSSSNGVTTYSSDLMASSGIFFPPGARLVGQMPATNINGRMFFVNRLNSHECFTHADAANRAFDIYEREGRKTDSPAAHWNQALAELGLEENQLVQPPPLPEQSTHRQISYTLHSSEQADGEEKTPPPAMYSLQFKQAPIRLVTDYYGQLAGQTVLLSQQVDPAANLTLKSNDRIPKSQAMRMIETALADQGILLIETNGCRMAIPAAKTRAP